MSTTLALAGAPIRARLDAVVSWVARHRALVAFCSLVGVYYLWTVWSSGSPVNFGERGSDYYNLLSSAFLHGHLHLLAEPSPHLLELKNPYDPAQNAPYAVHDLSLYKDHYYLYWGPTPALLLFMPFRLLQLGDMPETLAVFLFAFVGFCFSVACLRLLVRQFVPAAPRWMVGAALVALAFSNALPFTLRRVAVYEVAITAGFCLFFIALYLVITGLQDGLRLRRLGFASLLVGLAVGARPTMIVAALALVVLAVWLHRRQPDAELRRRTTAALLGPVVAVGLLLALYNVLRFGSPLEFGQRYQLAGYDPGVRHGNKPAYVPPGLWYYLFSRPHLTLGFPFFHLPPPPLSYPFTAPAEYDGVEPVGGLFTTTPFVLMALAAPFVLRGAGRRVGLALSAIGAVIVLMVSFALWGATMRYEVDFSSVLIISAAIGWIALAARPGQRWRRRVVGTGGALVIAWGATVGVAVGMTGYYDTLRSWSPSTFRLFQQLTSPLPTVVSYLGGSPKPVDLYAPGGIEANADPNGGIGALAFTVAATPTEVTVVSGKARLYGLRIAGTPAPAAPSAAPAAPSPAGTRLRIATPSTHRTLELPPVFPVMTVPIHLKRGLNRIVFTVSGPSKAAARVTDVQLAPAPRAAG